MEHKLSVSVSNSLLTIRQAKPLITVTEGNGPYGMNQSLTSDDQSDVIKAFNSTSRYLDDLLNIDDDFFDSMVNHIYPSELQLNKANVSDTEASFLDLHLSISDGFVIPSHNKVVEGI